MHQLESLGCDCLMATLSPIDNGTYVAGTEKAIKYFTDIQKVQPMSEFINGSLSPRDSLSGFSDDLHSDGTPTEERPQSESENVKDAPSAAENHVRGNASSRQGSVNGQGSSSMSSEGSTENGGGAADEGQRSSDGEVAEDQPEGGAMVVKKDQAVVQSGKMAL